RTRRQCRGGGCPADVAGVLAAHSHRRRKARLRPGFFALKGLLLTEAGSPKLLTAWAAAGRGFRIGRSRSTTVSRLADRRRVGDRLVDGGLLHPPHRRGCVDDPVLARRVRGSGDRGGDDHPLPAPNRESLFGAWRAGFSP